MIDAIEVFITELPTRVQRTFSSGSWDTGAPGVALGKPVLVKIHADGVTGYGQIRPISPGHFVADTVHSVVAAITEVYAPLLIGRELSAFEANALRLNDRLHANPAARAVLDIALHDALGKALGVPAYTLLGGLCQPRIPIEWSVSLAEEAAGMVAEAERAMREFGIKVLCLKAAGPKGWREDVRNFEAVRKAVGDDIVIGIDPNTGWTVAESLSAIEAIRPMGLGYVEQPIDRRDISGLAQIRKAANGVPLMADESLFTIHDAFDLAQARAVDVFCIKLYKVGGFSPARKIAAIAEAANIQLNCGGLAAQSQLEAAASAHFCAATPPRRMFGAAEFAFGLNLTAKDPFATARGFALKDGHVAPPEGPGLGVEIDEDALKRHTISHTRVG